VDGDRVAELVAIVDVGSLSQVSPKKLRGAGVSS